jgi:hypothetical protein
MQHAHPLHHIHAALAQGTKKRAAISFDVGPTR